MKLSEKNEYLFNWLLNNKMTSSEIIDFLLETRGVMTANEIYKMSQELDGFIDFTKNSIMSLDNLAIKNKIKKEYPFEKVNFSQKNILYSLRDKYLNLKLFSLNRLQELLSVYFKHFSQKSYPSLKNYFQEDIAFDKISKIKTINFDKESRIDNAQILGALLELNLITIGKWQGNNLYRAWYDFIGISHGNGTFKGIKKYFSPNTGYDDDSDERYLKIKQQLKAIFFNEQKSRQ